MNTCSGQQAELVAEQYVCGSLPEAEAQRFEEHYLECDACFEHVRALQAVREVFDQKRSAGFLGSVTGSGAWAAFAMAAAAIVIVSAALYWHAAQRKPQSVATQAPVEQKIAPPQSSSPQPAQAEAEASKPKTVELASIADTSLPPFREVHVRGASEDERFTSGMRAYAAKDCAAAIDEWKRVPRNSNWADAALLYTGVCDYHLQHFGDAHKTLADVAKNPESPFSETALYYLAQVALQQSHSADAQRWLKAVVALHGDYEARARAQLQKLNTLER